MRSRRRCRIALNCFQPDTSARTKAVRSLLVALATLMLPLSVASAADRNEFRFRRMLEGRPDGARIAAMQSISPDFQIRKQAMPIVITSMKKLTADNRFNRIDTSKSSDLPNGVRLMISFVGTGSDPESTQTLVDILDCGRTSWVMAAVHSLCKNKHHSAIDAVLSQMDSEHFESSYGFRFTMARGLNQMDHPEAWEGLARMFERVDGQLAHLLDEAFRDVSVDDFGGDAKRFEQWQDLVGLSAGEAKEEGVAGEPAIRLAGSDMINPDSNVPGQMSLKPATSAAGYTRQRLQPSNYYGIKIYAKRLLFVIDRSGSMKEVIGSESRIQRAKRELIKAIDGLDEDCEFGVLIFDTQVRGWKDQLIKANEKNKRSAIRFVEYLSVGNATNTYDALRKSLEFDPQLEAVFVLTDGQPTAGPVVNPNAILLDILARNEIHNVTINTIAIAVEPMMSTFLRNLSEPSDGEFRDVK